MPAEVHVELVQRNDPSYRAWISRLKKFRDHYRPSSKRDPFASDHQKICRQIEAMTLRYFATLLDAESNLILKVSRFPGAKTLQFLEIDFVKLERTTPVLFGELKFSVSPTRAKKESLKQLRKRINLAKARWPKVYGVAVCYHLVGFSDCANCPEAMLPQQRLPSAIEECLRSSTSISTFDLDVSGLFNELIDREWISNTLLQDFKEAFSHMKFPIQSPFFSNKSSKEINSLGDAFDNLDNA